MTWVMLFVFFINLSIDSFAICPACTLGAGATFTFAKMIGLSNLIVGILLSGILFSSAKWLGDFLGKKTHNILVYPLSFFIHYFSLYFIYGNFLSYKEEIFLGFDKFLFGIIVGFITSFSSYRLYLFLKKKNNNKPYFPYQKVFMYVISLIIVSLIFGLLE